MNKKHPATSFSVFEKSLLTHSTGKHFVLHISLQPAYLRKSQHQFS